MEGVNMTEEELDKYDFNNKELEKLVYLFSERLCKKMAQNKELKEQILELKRKINAFERGVYEGDHDWFSHTIIIKGSEILRLIHRPTIESGERGKGGGFFYYRTDEGGLRIRYPWEGCSHHFDCCGCQCSLWAVVNKIPGTESLYTMTVGGERNV
jgi:hypothetical protein